MAFERIIGQKRAIGLLQNVLKSGRLGHAYLFDGPVGVGKFAVAVEFARALLCEQPTESGACGQCSSCRQVDQLGHPSLKVLLPGPKEMDADRERQLLNELAAEPYNVERTLKHPTISLQRVHELRHFAAFAGQGERGAVVLIPVADRMTQEAANSLLKTLEEPAPGLRLILTTADPGALPATIVSRCQRLRFPPLTDEDVATALVERFNAEPETARMVARLSSGNFSLALSWLEADTSSMWDLAVEFLRAAVKDLRSQAEFVSSLVPRSDNRRAKKKANLELSERAVLLEFLDVLQVWLRDAQLVRELGPEAAKPLLVNPHQLETLVRFNTNLKNVDYAAVFSALDEAGQQYRRNVSAFLLLMGLVQRFHRAIRR